MDKLPGSDNITRHDWLSFGGIAIGGICGGAIGADIAGNVIPPNHGNFISIVRFAFQYCGMSIGLAAGSALGLHAGFRTADLLTLNQQPPES